MKKSLHDLIEFDAPFRVHEDGSVSREEGVYAPYLFDEQIDLGWEMLNGYSGQDSYSGPIMHNSEYIGGELERDILAAPGVYVLVPAYWPTENEDDEDRPGIEGWAIARQVP